MNELRRPQFIEVHSDLGAGTRGASSGIDALKVAALNFKSDVFQKYASIPVYVESSLLFNTIKNEYARRIDGILEVYNSVRQKVYNTLDKGKFPIILAGDHSSAGATIAGLKQKFVKDRIGVIWIDAHADIHSPYTTHSGNIHGMPLATALAEDNKGCKRNIPNEHTVQSWNKMKELGGVSPKIAASDLVYVGLRDFEEEEEYIINNLGIKCISVPELRQIGAEETAMEILEYLKSCDYLYVSFDVDSLDSDNVSSGTGTPVRGGFYPGEVLSLLNIIFKDARLKAFEIVEINPFLDVRNKMAQTAFLILNSLLKYCD